MDVLQMAPYQPVYRTSMRSIDAVRTLTQIYPIKYHDKLPSA